MSTELDKTTGAELDVITDKAEIAQALAGLIESRFQDSDQVQADIALRILSAETLDEAFAEPATWNTEALVGVPIEVYSARMARSRHGQDGKGAFVVATIARMDDGTPGILTTSAVKVAARIMWCELNDALPIRLRIRPPVTTATGNTAYDVEAL